MLPIAVRDVYFKNCSDQYITHKNTFLHCFNQVIRNSKSIALVLQLLGNLAERPAGKHGSNNGFYVIQNKF